MSAVMVDPHEPRVRGGERMSSFLVSIEEGEGSNPQQRVPFRKWMNWGTCNVKYKKYIIRASLKKFIKFYKIKMSGLTNK